MSTRKASRSSRALARVLACALVAAGAGCGSQLTIHLQAAADLNGVAPPFVKIDVQELGKDKPTDFGPFSIDAVPGGELAPVPPGQRFFIDVIGCPARDPKSCPDDQPETFIARGCTDFITLTKDDGQDVTIVVHNAVVGAQRCPPKPPA